VELSPLDVASLDRPVRARTDRQDFVREVPRAALDERSLARQQRILIHGVSTPTRWWQDGASGFIASRRVEGTSLAELAQTGARIAWPVALALVHDVAMRLHQLRYMIHPEVTPARVRFGIDGVIHVCLGAPPLAHRSWPRANAAILAALLGLAATAEEQAMLAGILDGDSSNDPIAIASDALALRHPEYEALFPAVLLPLSGFAMSLDAARRQLLPLVGKAQLAELWQLV